jgi:pyruvate dehydrogenase E2 component (dihydrolipoamide acetyltransferase)
MADFQVKLPELGEGVTEGELIKYLVQVGDTVTADQSIAEVMTDKATVEVPSPVAGKVTSLSIKVGDIIHVEKTLLTLAVSESSSAKAPPEKTTAETKAPSTSAAPKNTHAPAALSAKPAVQSTSIHSGNGLDMYPPAAEERVLATPATRKLARELSVDINNITGTGIAQRVTREDVLNSSTSAVAPSSSPGLSAKSTPVYTQAGDEKIPIRGIRRKIAESMQHSKSVIPHFTLMDEAEVTALKTLRESVKEVDGVKITYLPFMIKTLIQTCKVYPMFNASIDDAAQEIIYRKNFHIGFAADTPQGLVVPVIKNADQKSIIEIAKEILDLSKRARENKLKPDEMKGATITITNIGSIGGNYATPIINHPEVAILGMYKIQDKLKLVGDKIQTSQVMNLTITADHRLIDGAMAAHFLKTFIEKIQNPGRMFLEMH